MNLGAIAYFSMEIALEDGMPTYSGGLGVLAGDTIRSAADLSVPLAAVTLLHRKGYFRQRLDAQGRQTEERVDWVLEDFLEETPATVSVLIEGRQVRLRAWKYRVTGVSGYQVPVYFLDADLPGNSAADRTLTHFLYGGDQYYRLCQEVILGIGGVRMLRALGYRSVRRFHLNEGHASLLTLELLEEAAQAAGRSRVSREDIQKVRAQCVFTTHTPVPAGHDQFPLDLVTRVLAHRAEDFIDLQDVFCVDVFSRVMGGARGSFDLEGSPPAGQLLNMTYLALNLSSYVNGVAKKHGEVSRLMFAGYAVDAITNGVHAATWTSQPFQELFDCYVPDWRQDNYALRYALSISRDEVWEAHMRAKRSLLAYVHREAGVEMDEDLLTLGFARRAAAYKRADLLFTDVTRLKSIAARSGGLQVLYAGKAHPRDQGGKEVIQRVCRAGAALGREVQVVYLEDYDIELGRLMTSGVDVWLNTPQPPNEASGTSGMKAALNGVPSLSILDGWWIEGHIPGITGWAIGRKPRSPRPAPDGAQDAASLYRGLEEVILPLFYQDRPGFIDVMRHAIALNGSFFNTQRMVSQYVVKAYFK